jgi:hypothetical protein
MGGDRRSDGRLSDPPRIPVVRPIFEEVGQEIRPSSDFKTGTFLRCGWALRSLV